MSAEAAEPKRIIVYVTSIMATAKIRANHELLHKALRPYMDQCELRDLAADQTYKPEWKRVNQNNTELPCIVTDGERVGTMEELSEGRLLYLNERDCNATFIAMRLTLQYSHGNRSTNNQAQLKQFLRLDRERVSTQPEDIDADLSNLSEADAEKLAAELNL